MTKYDSIFFIFGLTALLLFKNARNALIEHKFWVNSIVFLICITPNIVWQYLNNFPALQMISRLYETQLDNISRWDNILNLLIGINPIASFLLVIPAFLYLIKSKDITLVRILSITIGLSFVLLFYKNAKSYYFYPLILTLLPFGAVFWEQIVWIKRKWLVYPKICHF